MKQLTLTVSDAPADDVPASDERMRFCEFLATGFEGRDVCFQADLVKCPLGRFNLGVGASDEAQRRKLAKVLVRWGDIGTEAHAQAYLDDLPTARLAGRWITLRPSDAYPRADLVVARGTPVEIMDLVQRYAYHTSRTLRTNIGGIGASCGEIVAAALATGEPTLSLGCGGTRRHGRLPDTELLLGAPREVYQLMG